MGSCAFSKFEYQNSNYVGTNNINLIFPDETSDNKYTCKTILKRFFLKFKIQRSNIVKQ